MHGVSGSPFSGYAGQKRAYTNTLCMVNCRPDLYPWLIDVFVAEPFRGRGVGRALLETVPENARNAGLTELYLYTTHAGLYEKFGWTYVGEVYP